MKAAEQRGPRRVVLLRHAEKTGRAGDRDLSAAGDRRAQALVEVVPRQLGAIDFVIAANTTPGSARPRLTVRPFAKRAGLDIDERWGTKDFADLAATLTQKSEYVGKAVLICWRHEALQPLAVALGVAVAPPWPEDMYDPFWIIDYLERGPVFQVVPQAIEGAGRKRTRAPGRTRRSS